MELSNNVDDSTPWNKMDVRSSEESPMGFLFSKSRLIAAAIVLFLIAIFAILHHVQTGIIESMNNDMNHPVAPIFGEAYLTADEFRDIRTANGGESVLVTGGLGFIGSHVVELLLHRGFKVTILDDESNGHNHNGYAKELVPKDITVVGDLPKFPIPGQASKEEGYYTHVIHLAAAISVAESMKDGAKYERINYQGSQKVMEWIDGYNINVSSDSNTNMGIKKLVAASSAAIYGDPDPSLLPLQESTPYGGLSPYADTKYRMEGLMKNFVENQDKGQGSAITNAIALRFFNVYGPRQDPKNPYSGVISLFLEAALLGKDITILGDGEMTRDFVYVKDVARAIVLALLKEEDEKYFGVFNVCTGKTITINTLADQIKTNMESQSDVTHLDPRDGDIRASSCNPNGAQESIGFKSAVTQEGGLAKTAAWFRSEDDSRELRSRRRSSGEWLLEQFGSPSVNRLLEFIGSFFTDNARSPENFPDTCDGFQEVLDGNCIYTNCVGVTNGDKCFSCGTECNNGCGSDVIEGITDFPEWSFSRPCCIHDYCYSTTFTQSECDSAFYEDMLEECPGKKLLTAKEQLECTLSNITDVDCCPAWAATYYAAVVGFGSDSYDEAQENMATHCPVETENSATTRWWQNPKESFFEYELQ